MDIDRIITETDLETIKARLLLGDRILLKQLGRHIIDTYRLSPGGFTIPSLADRDRQLIIPKRDEIIKITRFSEVYTYHNNVIFYGNNVISMDNFLKLYEEFNRENNNVR